MAKPSGAITPGDGGYDAQGGTSNWSAAYFCFRLPYQPKHWDGTFYTSPRHSIQPSFQYVVAAGNTLREKWRFSGDPSGNSELGEADTGVGAGWKSRNETSPLKGMPCNAPPLSNPSTLPRYSVGRVQFQEPSGSGGVCEMVGVHVELLDVDEYTDPDPTGERSVELTDRATIRLHDADQPASAWHAQWLLCHSMNKIEYEARQCWSVPF